ncbi:hypothetical protein CEXT_601001 [Caerostris extrusa]|uniref:Uncharacterized protein n=1 Tax=Caerostris extrusa TaxID=172846 RepID=A0AAV4TD79_CAEEX|nr:hypothetical protein CEXT_601001 [Caerostris extrusa]
MRAESSCRYPQTTLTIIALRYRIENLLHIITFLITPSPRKNTSSTTFPPLASHKSDGSNPAPPPPLNPSEGGGGGASLPSNFRVTLTL